VEEVFLRVIEVPLGDRERVLTEECGGDRALRTEVESLVAEHDADPDFLESPPPWLQEPGDAADDPSRLGPYRVIRRLGRGGMGTVYLAEHRAEGFTREVAVKVVRRGLDTDDVLARFRSERQILARLTHPNIAALLDVGAMDDGRPYLVVEHVAGVPLREWCEGRALGLDERLRLMVEICDAVDHAHRHLVVHRDLKPGNVLVTAEGTPKLLDFGIAKILEPGGRAATGLTREGQRVLTLGYASPEQIRGDPVTTAVDVYALGVILYEMIAGVHPVEARLEQPRDQWSRGAVERAVTEADPPPPGAAAARGRSRPGGAPEGAGEVRIDHDLDTVVLKALAREPDERYPSAGALSDDLRRYLAGFPVEARPSSALYRASRFTRRNPWLVTAVASALVILVASTALVAYQSSRILAESERVARERDKALEVRSFLLESFGATGPDQPAGDAVTVRTLLDNRAATVDADFADDPEMRAEMRMVLAEAYDRLGLHAQAEPLAREALELRRTLFGGPHADVATSLNLLGWILHQSGRTDEAEPLLREAVTVGRRVFADRADERLARALNDLGVAREAVGAYEEAEALYRESLAERREAVGPGDQAMAVTRSNLAVVLYRLGKMEEAVDAAEDALERFRAAFGPDHQRSTIVQSNLAAMRFEMNDYAGAEREHREILERRRRTLGPEHPQVAFSMTMLANDLIAQDRPEEAEPLVVEALAIQRSALGERHPDVASTVEVLGEIRLARGSPDEAVRHFEVALDLTREHRGDRHPDVAGTLGRIGKAHLEGGRLDEAVKAFEDAYELYREVLGVDHFRTVDMALELASRLVTLGDSARAAELADEGAGALGRAGVGEDHWLSRALEGLNEQLGRVEGGDVVPEPAGAQR